MRTPAFWRAARPGLTARALQPIGMVYGAIAARRMARPGVALAVPVMCIGNFIAGGAGKTPTALTIAEILRKNGETPFFLTRGYGGRGGAAPIEVDLARHDAARVGDEPMLLAAAGRTIVSADRVRGARRAIELGASVVLMDDGLQNPSLQKALTIAVVDGGFGHGNGLCLPAGPLRAPLAAQWPRVDAVVLIGPGETNARIAREAQAQDAPVFLAELVPDADIASQLRGARVIAFAGIGRPEKFFATLADLGAEIVARRAFGDHHDFRPAELSVLAREAAQYNARLVTTTKDYVRIAPGARPPGLIALPVRLALRDPTGLAGLLTRALATFRRAS